MCTVRTLIRRKRKTGGERKRGLIVVTGDKGLAGAYNHNVLKMAEEWMEKECEPPPVSWWENLDGIILLSRRMPVDRAVSLYRYRIRQWTEPGLISSTTVVGRFMRQELDEVYIAFTRRWINSHADGRPGWCSLLPLEREDFSSSAPGRHLPGGVSDGCLRPRQVLDHDCSQLYRRISFSARL